MNVFILGVAMHPPAQSERALRLEEMAYRTSSAALDHAAVSRAQLDSLTIGACDELDGRPISSMLMSAPAGGYHVDEIKVTDSGMTALALACARFESGETALGLVTGWCKASKADVDAVMRLRGDPFFTRPLAIDHTVGDALFAQAVGDEMGIGIDEVDARVAAATVRAAANPRGIGRAAQHAAAIAATPWDATPLRAGHRAPHTDGAAALVLASGRWVAMHPGCTPIARITGIGWASDSYRLDRVRLSGMASARHAWTTALTQAGLGGARDADVVELDAQTGWHEAAYVRAFGIDDECAISPSGGPFAQNPFFASGLVHAVEAALQVAGQAGRVQRPGARRAIAHGCHGIAQQGNVVAVLESAQ